MFEVIEDFERLDLCCTFNPFLIRGELAPRSLQGWAQGLLSLVLLETYLAMLRLLGLEQAKT